MSDLISKQEAIEAIKECAKVAHSNHEWGMEQGYINAIECLEELPSVQLEQTKMIEEIREWINSKNRGSADYFIVDMIEEIISKYE